MEIIIEDIINKSLDLINAKQISIQDQEQLKVETNNYDDPIRFSKFFQNNKIDKNETENQNQDIQEHYDESFESDSLEENPENILKNITTGNKENEEIGEGNNLENNNHDQNIAKTKKFTENNNNSDEEIEEEIDCEKNGSSQQVITQQQSQKSNQSQKNIELDKQISPNLNNNWDELLKFSKQTKKRNIKYNFDILDEKIKKIENLLNLTNQFIQKKLRYKKYDQDKKNQTCTNFFNPNQTSDISTMNFNQTVNLRQSAQTMRYGQQSIEEKGEPLDKQKEIEQKQILNELLKSAQLLQNNFPKKIQQQLEKVTIGDKNISPTLSNGSPNIGNGISEMELENTFDIKKAEEFIQNFNEKDITEEDELDVSRILKKKKECNLNLLQKSLTFKKYELLNQNEEAIIDDYQFVKEKVEQQEQELENEAIMIESIVQNLNQEIQQKPTEQIKQNIENENSPEIADESKISKINQSTCYSREQSKEQNILDIDNTLQKSQELQQEYKEYQILDNQAIPTELSEIQSSEKKIIQQESNQKIITEYSLSESQVNNKLDLKNVQKIQEQYTTIDQQDEKVIPNQNQEIITKDQSEINSQIETQKEQTAVQTQDQKENNQGTAFEGSIAIEKPSEITNKILRTNEKEQISEELDNVDEETTKQTDIVQEIQEDIETTENILNDQNQEQLRAAHQAKLMLKKKSHSHFNIIQQAELHPNQQKPPLLAPTSLYHKKQMSQQSQSNQSVDYNKVAVYEDSLYLNDSQYDQSILNFSQNQSVNYSYMNDTSILQSIPEYGEENLDILKTDDQAIQKVPQFNAKKSQIQSAKSSTQTIFSTPPEPTITDDTIIKQGFLWKKRRNILSRWGKKYFVLQQNRITYYNTQKKEKMNGVINFAMVQCEIQNSKGQQFEIKIKGYKRIFTLKAAKTEEAADWINKIIACINEQRTVKVVYGDNYMKKYSKFLQTTEKDLSENAQTGDILLFQTDNFGAKFQRSLTGSKYDHVGMVVRLESTPNKKRQVYVFDAQMDSNCDLREWNFFIDYNNLFTRVVWRKLTVFKQDEKEVKKQIYKFVTDQIGKKYALNVGKFFSRKKENDSENEGFFCSELIAACYKSIKILPSKVSSSQYWPGTFSTEKKKKILIDAELGEERAIVLEKDKWSYRQN